MKAIDRIKQKTGALTAPRPKGMTDIIEGMPARLPSGLILSRGLKVHSAFPAGRVIVLKTETPVEVIACYSKRMNLGNMDGMATSAVDVYRKEESGFRYISSIFPDEDNRMYAEAEIPEGGELHFLLPSYASLAHLYVSGGTVISPEKGRKMVCYGSSITQGCAASRPGRSYVNMLYLAGFNTVNYGFSESARGEPAIIKHIAKEHADIYVMEYDHNSPVEELEARHLSTYRILRSENTESLIIYLSRISGGISVSREEAAKRVSIIRATVEQALESGDRHIAFLDGTIEDPAPLLKDDRHPNDIGMELFKRRITDCVDQNDKETGARQGQGRDKNRQ